MMCALNRSQILTITTQDAPICILCFSHCLRLLAGPVPDALNWESAMLAEHAHMQWLGVAWMPGSDRSGRAQSSWVRMQTGLRGRAAFRSSLCTSRWRKSGPASISALDSSESPNTWHGDCSEITLATRNGQGPFVTMGGGPRPWQGMLGLSMGVSGMPHNLQHPARFLLGQA